MKKWMVGILYLMFPCVAYSATYTDSATIRNITVGKDFARVKMSKMSPAEGCEKADWYILHFTDEGSHEMYSMLLAVKTTGQQVKFALTGCNMRYPKIVHIYN
jgi:hypothetical protein